MPDIGKIAARPIKLPQAPDRYDKTDVDRTRRMIEQAFAQYGISLSTIAKHVRVIEESAGGGPMLPVPGAVAWYDVQQLGLGDGEPVTMMPNLVESYLGDATPDNATMIDGDGINGHPALLPSGGTDTVIYAGPPEYTTDTPTFPFTVMMVYYIDVDWTPPPAFFDPGVVIGFPLYGNSGAIEFGSQVPGLSETNWYINALLFDDQAGSGGGNNVFQTGQQPATGMHIFALVVRAEDDYDIVIDGVKYTGTVPFIIADNADSYCLMSADGWGLSFGGASIITARAGEFIRYDSALSDVDRETLEAYLLAKWS